MPQFIFALLAIVLLGVHATPSSAIEQGRGVETVTAGMIDITVFTYRPRDCTDPSFLIVFHGMNRKAETVRNNAEDAADSLCLIVIAPHFDKQRFPNWRYQRAGVVREGRIQPRAEWTAPVVAALVDWVRRQTNRPDAKLYLFGHSAGGQLLGRVFAYAPISGIERIVIANPSVYVLPLLTEPVPTGFEGVFSDAEAEQRVRAYLALPITIYLGSEDTGSKNLVRTDAAMRQGNHRRERGHTVFRMAAQIAAQRGWPFHWELIEAPGVGHSSRAMLSAPAFAAALGLPGPGKE